MTKHPSRATLVQLSGVMLFLFAGVSAIQFHAVLFEKKGFEGLQVGLLLGLGQAASIFSPLAQAGLARWSGGPKTPLLFMLLLSSLSFGILPHLKGFYSLAIMFFVASFGYSGLFPLNTAFTLDAVRNKGRWWYFGLRSLGTLGFLFGCFMSVLGARHWDLSWLYIGFSAAFLLAFGFAWFIPHPIKNNTEYSGKKGFWNGYSLEKFRKFFQTFKHTPAAKVLWRISLLSVANHSAIALQGVYIIREMGGDLQTVSWAWVLSTTFEIPIMLACGWMMKKQGLHWVILFGFAGSLIRTAGMALAPNLLFFFISLIFHGAFYAGAISGYGVLVDRIFDEQIRPSVQAFSAAVYNGVPAALAGILAGALWEWMGIRAVFGIASLIAFAAFLILLPELNKTLLGLNEDAEETASLSQGQRSDDN